MKKMQLIIKLFCNSFGFLGSARKKYILGVILGACELALLFAMPYVNSALIEHVTGQRQDNIMTTLLYMLAMFLLLVPAVIAGKYMQSTAVKYGSANLYKEMFWHITHIPFDLLVKTKSGDYITRLRDDADRTVGVLGPYSFGSFIRFIAVFPVTLILLLENNWYIAIAGIVYGCINLAFSLWLNPISKQMETQAKHEIVKSASFMLETLRGIPVVRVFVMHQVLSARYHAICQIIREKRVRYQIIIGITYGVVDFFAQSAQAVGFLIGVFLSHDNVLSDTVFNATLMGMMADSIFRLSTFLLMAQPDFLAMERVHNLLNQPLEEVKGEQSQRPLEYDNIVEFKNVSFSYDNQDKTIDGLSFVLHKGEHLAIVGGSGGGKSTIVKLMAHFYSPNTGQIFYYGQDGNSLSLTEIRNIFAYVPQECSLFDGSIRENIILARPEASQQEIESATKRAGIHEFILSLPEGYETQIGEGGGQLSGGQKQRLAIARGLLKEAPVLLLDEATAALDSVLENEVQTYLDSISCELTTVTIAHRLSTVEKADRIFVMENGRIVEEGTFQTLIGSHGRFREIYESQKKSFED